MTVLPLSWKMGLVTNEGEEIIGRRGGDYAVTETDTIAVGVREGDEEDEAIIDGDLLYSNVSHLCSVAGS
jgi:hypothetical protein